EFYEFLLGWQILPFYCLAFWSKLRPMGVYESIQYSGHSLDIHGNSVCSLSRRLHFSSPDAGGVQCGVGRHPTRPPTRGCNCGPREVLLDSVPVRGENRKPRRGSFPSFRIPVLLSISGNRLRGTGTIASFSLISSDSGRFHARAVNGTVAEMTEGTSRAAPLSAAEKSELEYWVEWSAGPCSRPFTQSEASDDFIIEVDASNAAVGAILRASGGLELNGARNLEPSQSLLSSTHRELLAIDFGVAVFLEQIKNRAVRIFCDNQSAVQIAKVGSAKDSLHSLARSFRDRAAGAGVKLAFTWIPREMNAEADAASIIDLFADQRTAKAKIFLSRGAEVGSRGIDSFAFPGYWRTSSLSWCVPPPSLLNRVVRMAKDCKARLILGFPLWFGNPGITSLRKGAGWIEEVLDVFVYPKGAPILIPSALAHSIFASKNSPSPFVFMLCQF
ncbi:hypothetical protein PMAYCL1PPCAC_21828, partial [Pristionchus mayeri]